MKQFTHEDIERILNEAFKAVFTRQQRRQDGQ